MNTGKAVQLTHQIKCATFTLSNNSNNLIMAGNQKYGRGISVGILDLNNSELTKEIKSDTNQSYGGTPSFITLTPDERYAIVGCPASPTSTNYVVFDLTTQQELVQPPTITLDSDPKCSIVINNDQSVTGTKNGQLVLWDIPTCQRLNTLNDNGQNAHRDRITDLKLSPDRSCFVSSSADGTAKVWDANTKELISKLIGHKREVKKENFLIQKKHDFIYFSDHLFMYINKSISRNWFKRSKYLLMAFTNWSNSLNNACWYDTS